MASHCLFLALLLAVSTQAAEPKTELLWPAGAPGKLGDEAKDKPTLIIYLPDAEKATGCGIVVCPGGGYGGLAMDHEGHQIARWLNSFGVAAFICDYRHRGKGYGHPAPLQDAQRAIRTVRHRAKEFGVQPDRVGIMGFSAGGHLTSTALTHFDKGKADDADSLSARPFLAAPIYPVLSMDAGVAHMGSRKNLLGSAPADEALVTYSPDRMVTPDTPPCFLTHSETDTSVPVENTLVFRAALKKAGVTVETHLFPEGGHGFGLRNVVGKPTHAWGDLFLTFARARGLYA